MDELGFPTSLSTSSLHPFTKFEDEFVLHVIGPKIPSIIEAAILQGSTNITPDLLRTIFCETYGVQVQLVRWRRWLRLLNIEFVTLPGYSRLDPLP